MVARMTTLQSVLRNQLGHTAVKDGCRQGGCGSCTVLVDGEPMMSLPAARRGRRGPPGHHARGPHPGRGPPPDPAGVPRANGFQCGYCTPGMVMVAKALLDHNPAPTPRRDRGGAAGNVCRCTGYGRSSARSRRPRPRGQEAAR